MPRFQLRLFTPYTILAKVYPAQTSTKPMLSRGVQTFFSPAAK